MALKRELGIVTTTLYGIGVILGAGIYALIAVGAGLAGNMLWLAFVISACIAILTALSYAELSSVFQRDAAEYNYTKKAFKHEALSFSVGWVLAIGTMVAASTVAFGFGGYFSALTGADARPAALGLICLMTLLNFWGIKESAGFNNVATTLEMLGLLIVIAAGFMAPPAVDADLLELPPGGIGGIAAAVSIIFFAYIGFENVANLSEEVRDAKKTVPRALVLALIISTILYILVAVAAVREVGWEALAGSQAPLTLVVSRALGGYAHVLSYIALFATANTVLMFLIVASRMLYGMAEGGSLDRRLAKTGSRGTPFLSVASIGLGAAGIVLLSDIKTVAQLTDISVFLAYIAVNASVIALANARLKRSFLSPRLMGAPVLAWLGLFSSAIMLAFFPMELWIAETAILGAGLALYFANRSIGRRARSPGA